MSADLPVDDRPPRPGEAQRAAADPAVSAWVDASAGSGKTKVLTDRVLALLLSGAEPHAILCLTFTKAAAGEMANRFANRLGLWARASEKELADDLADLHGRPPKTEELDRARRLFAQVQEVPGGVRIDTVHGFCRGVLQRFPIEARVPPHFDVLEEREQRLLLAAARGGLIRAVATEPESPLTHAWGRCLARLTEGGFAKLSSEIVANRDRLARPRAADVAAMLGVEPGATAESTLADACAGDVADMAPLLGLLPAMEQANAENLRTAAKAIADHFSRPPSERDFRAYARALLRKDNKPLALSRFNPFRNDPDLYAPIADEQERLVEVFRNLAKVEALADTTALLTVARDLLGRYERAKRSRSLLDYDDLILGAAGLLDDSGAAWVHYKLDGGIDHVLVDEAQDTNPAQWRVIAGLVAEFFAGEGAAADQGRRRTLFAVGDPKQSIYSFQGADPTGFLDRRAEFSAKAEAGGRVWRDVPLTVSFRSAPPVLQLVDEVFADPSRLGIGVDQVRHQAYRADAPGWVELWPPLSEPEAAENDDIWTLPRNYEQSLSTEERLARLVAGKIADLIASGELPAADKNRPIRAGDIMVLVRRRRRFGTALVAALKRMGVPVAGVDRMQLARQLVVQDLSAFGQFLLLPDDDLNLAAVLKGPFFRWSEERLYRLAQPREGSLWQALNAAEARQDREDADRLTRWLRQAPGLAPFRLYNRLLIEDGGRQAVRAVLGTEADDPLDEFMALALDFPRRGVPSLQHFLHWLAADQVEIKRETEQGGRDEVRLLTVHAAKGLEAPIVFLPDTFRGYEESANQRPNLFWRDKTPIWSAGKAEARDPVSATLMAERRARLAEEEARLLYVALTRAEDRLYICAWEGRKKKARETTWYGAVEAAFERLKKRGAVHEIPPLADGPEGPIFALGTPPAPRTDRRSGEPAARPAPLPPWGAAPASPEPSPNRPLAPSRPSALPPAVRSPLRDRAAAERRFRRGTLLHRLFQYLPGAEPAARAKLAAQILRDADLSEAETARLVESVARVLDDSAFASVFAADALVEVPLTGLIDDKVVSGTVDRLLVSGEKVLVVDYKTNRAPPSDPIAVPDAYRRQMQAYASLLAQVYPGRRIDCALLWTEVPRLDPVPLHRTIATSIDSGGTTA